MTHRRNASEILRFAAVLSGLLASTFFPGIGLFHASAAQATALQASEAGGFVSMAGARIMAADSFLP